MFDYLKCITYSPITKLPSHNNLESTSALNLVSGEINQDIEVKFGRVSGTTRPFRTKIFPSNRIETGGSIHKFYKDSGNNNDFTYSQFLDSLKELESSYGFDILNQPLIQLEFGVMVDHIGDPWNFISSIISSYQGNDSETLSTKHGRSIGRVIKFRDYRIKFYVKPFENRELLRIEIHYQRSRAIRKLGVNSLNDLTKQPVLRAIIDDFNSKLDNIYSVERESFDKLPSDSQIWLYKTLAGQTWKDMTSMQRRRAKERILKLGSNQPLFNIRGVINNKINELTAS